MNRQRVVLITGASSGIGKACAEHLHQRGYRVYGTSRRAPKFPDELAASTDQLATFNMIPMDVTSEESVEQGVQWIMTHEGQIDVVVNNAGYGLAGVAEDTQLAVDEILPTNMKDLFSAVNPVGTVVCVLGQERKN